MNPVYDPILVVFLEQLQQQSGRRRSEKVNLPKDLEDRIAKMIIKDRFESSPPDGFRDHLRKEYASLFERSSPSDYELPWLYNILSDRFERIHRKASEYGIDIATKPLLGTLDTGTVNAMCVRPPHPIVGHLLLFESEMFSFCSVMSNAFVRCLPVDRNEAGFLEYDFDVRAVLARLREESDVRIKFLAPILMYAVTGRPSNAPYLPLTYSHSQLGDLFRLVIEFFVVGHEYGHLVAGHLDEATPMSGVFSGAKVEALSHSWDHEFVADLLGIRFAIPIIMQQFDLDPSTPFMGVSLYFQLMDFMDRTVSVLETGEVHKRQIGSHPTAALRIDNLRHHLPNMFAAYDPILFDSAIKGADRIGMMMELIWKMCLPRLLSAREHGVRPWEKWRTALKRD